MARSDYVYAVEDHECGHESLRAVFTVKYELVDWLGRQEPDALEFLRVTRHHDGFWRGTPVPMGSGAEVYERERGNDHSGR